VVLLSVDSNERPGWVMAPPDFWLAPSLSPNFVVNFTFNFACLTYATDNFQPAIF